MSVQTFTDLGDNASIQSAIDDMENAIDRAYELRLWLSNRVRGSKETPFTNATSAFEDMMGMADQSVADMEDQIAHAKEAMTCTDEARAERDAEREAQERIVI